MTEKENIENIVNIICGCVDFVLRTENIGNNPALLSKVKLLRKKMCDYLIEDEDNSRLIYEDIEIVDGYIAMIEEIQEGLYEQIDELDWLKLMAKFIKAILTDKN